MAGRVVVVGRTRTLTDFGKDLDTLLARAGKFTLREYADECGVSYKYLLQLRTAPTRRPGRLYPDLLKPFTRLKIIGLTESQQMSLRHRGKPLSLAESRAIFPELPDQQLLEAIKQAAGQKYPKEVRDRPEQPAAEEGVPHISAPEEPPPLYRRGFVGREAELRQLRIAFDSAMVGRGSLLMVVGEPGIGKTALCEQLAAYVTSMGGQTVVGHCYSERSLSRPYLAFVEALRSRLIGRDKAELEAELGRDAADLARIVPEIRERLTVRPRPKGDPEEEKYRLMESVVHVFGNIAAVQPLLVVLEDLHNADKGTLEMLTHVSWSMGGARVLIVGTYRDVEVDRTHPLSAALAELRRLPSFRRVLLRGLNGGDVRRMFSIMTGKEPPTSLSEAIYEQTEGNPLFVQEVIRYLAEEGLVSPQGEVRQPSSDVPVEMKIPDGLRDVIGKRLSRLSESCNRVLAVAAVIGREFSMDVLREVANVSDEELFKALEEAIRASVIEEKAAVLATVNYRFSHAFFCQTLYEEIIAPRRIRLHQQAARALEKVYGNRLEEHAAALAEHFSHSSDSADLAKAVAHGEVAAQRAISVFAYGEAARLLRQTITVQEVLDPQDKAKRCDLFLALCQSLLDAGESQRILDTEAARAFSLAEAIGDSQRACKACTLVYFAWRTKGMTMIATAQEAAPWVERADRHAPPDTIERVWADAMASQAAFFSGRWVEADVRSGRALRLARRLGDPQALWHAAGARLFGAPPSVPEKLLLADEMARLPRTEVPFEMIWSIDAPSGYVLLSAGRRQDYEKCFQEMRELAVRRGFADTPAVVFRLMQFEATEATLDGRLEEAVDISRRLIDRGDEFGRPEEALGWAMQGGLRPMLYLGKAGEFLENLVNGQRYSHHRDSGVGSEHVALWLAHLGRNAEACQRLDKTLASQPTMGSPDDQTLMVVQLTRLEAAVLAGHREVAGRLLRRIAGSGAKVNGTEFHMCVDRLLGDAAELLGKTDKARVHYQEAIRVATEVRFRPELALSRLGLAESLLQHYPAEKKEALEHLEFAIKEFREMKMQPSLERALRHKDILKA